MRVYLSGKMTGLPDLGFAAFSRAAASLRASGYEVINPAELDAADAAPKEWHEYLRRDIAQLVTCDAIALLPNWTDSRGARLERHIAKELGMREIFVHHNSEATTA
jgi:hypothetical protein